MADDQLIDDGTLDAWQEIARRDDWHMRIVGSDIRMLIGDLRRARHRLAHTARPDAGDEVERVARTPVCWRYEYRDAVGKPWHWRYSDTEVRVSAANATFVRNPEPLFAAMREGVDWGMVEVLREVEQAARAYFDSYLLDEADSEDDCVCGREQHLAAARLGDALKAVAVQHDGMPA